MLPLLSLILATLAVGTVATFFAGRQAKWVALAVSLLFVAEVGLLFLSYSGWPGYNGSLVPGFAESESYPWIHLSWLQINYTVGVDGISLVFILLTAGLQILSLIHISEPTRP